MKYTTEKVKHIADLIKVGLPVRHACVAADIDESTFYLWREKYPDFQAVIKKAEAERLAGLLAHIRRDSSWQSKAWLCQHLYKEFHLPSVSEKELLDRLEALEKRLELL